MLGVAYRGRGRGSHVAGAREAQQGRTDSASLPRVRSLPGSLPHNPERFWGQPADAVLALLPGKTEQEVRADMLDALIDRYLHGSRASHAMPDHVISWIRSQPEYKARYVGAVSG